MPLRRTLEPIRSILRQIRAEGRPSDEVETATLSNLQSDFPLARLLNPALLERLIHWAASDELGEPFLNEHERELLKKYAPGSSVRGFLVDGELPDLGRIVEAVLSVLGEGLGMGWHATHIA